jgi:subtilisin family serine protease
VYPRQVAPQARQWQADALLQKARQRGRIRVIVGLDVAMRDDGDLSPAEDAAQVQRLRRVQDGVARRSIVSANRVVKYETVPFMSVLATRDQLERLLNDPQVVSVQEDMPLRPFLSKSVPLIRANKLWRQGFRGNRQIVAVLDSGAQYAHPMLSGKIVAGLCRSGNATNGTSLCPGGVASSNALNSGQNCSAALDGCDHGTHVSSIAVGNSGSLKGVARRANLIAGQVFSRIDDAATCSPDPAPCIRASFTDINSALERIIRLARLLPASTGSRVASINMSLGGGEFNSACDASLPATASLINKLYRRGIATVIASGNAGLNSGISSPACISRAIAVGSTTKRDRVSLFSNHHDLVDLLAPGSRIKAAVLGGRMGVKSGTSMATPHVAGAIALLKNVRQQAKVNQILRALKKGVPVARAGVVKPRIDMVLAKTRLESLLP